ncbi:MAG: ABC transporter permease [Myxococcaceae bacterium]|nr:ABC transporter permease [Myxococcaceae bacterium]
MSFRVDVLEGMRIAVGSLRNHRLRTVLTCLGVGIGVATLLAIVGIIQGLNTSFDRQLQTLGSSVLYVQRSPWVQMGNWWEFRNRRPLGVEHAEAIRAQCPLAVAVEATMSETDDVSFQGDLMPGMNIAGHTADWPVVSGYEVVAGRFFTEADAEARRKVVVLGADVAETLFTHSSPLGATVKVGGWPYTVIGVLSRKGKVLDSNPDLDVHLPLESFAAQYGGRRSVAIGVLLPTAADLDRAEDQIVGIMRRARRTPPGKPDDFAINRPEMLAATYQRLTGALFGVAGGIGLITLLVGGIGIMNIMLVSVRERTREIGVRRALGARKRTIVAQFLFEAVMVSAIGGALGTAVGLGGAKIVSLITPLAATVKPLTVLFGVGFAASVGLLFGIWPAARAANLDPVEALRHE